MAFGSLARAIAPLNAEGDLRPLGVYADQRILATSWYGGVDTDLPDIEVFLGPRLPSFDELVARGWNGLRSGPPAPQPAWAWRWSLEDLKFPLRRLLDGRALHGGDSPFQDAAAWVAILALTGRGSLYQEGIPMSEIDAALDRIQGANSVYVLGRTYSLEPVRLCMEKRRNEGQTTMDPPWPPPDRLDQGMHFIWDPYSDDRLLERATAIYQTAIAGYEWLVEEWFPRFRHRLATRVALPARLDGLVRRAHIQESLSLGPHIHGLFEPLPRDRTSVVKLSWQDVGEDAWLDVATATYKSGAASMRERRSNEANWIGPVQFSSELEAFFPNSAIEIAYGWLWNDLRNIGWVDGLFSFRH